MIQETTVAIAALSYLQCKHFLCDFPLQTEYELKNKGTYGHPGGILHAGTHVIGTLPVFLVLSPPLGLMVLVSIGELVLHYHIDWAKERLTKRFRWTPADFGFWQLLGVDQLMHGLTYLGIVWTLIR